jgi:hypothetical protein
MREFWRVFGAFAIAMFFFYAIVFISYYVSRGNSQAALALEKYSLMIALREYRKEHAAYPILPDNPIGDLKKQLVSGGYLPPGPDADTDSRYVSLDGKSYGLMFHINRTPANPRGTPCLIEFEAIATGWWAQPPKCPF